MQYRLICPTLVEIEKCNDQKYAKYDRPIQELKDQIVPVIDKSILNARSKQNGIDRYTSRTKYNTK